MSKPETYLPALAYKSLTGLYDPVVRFTTREVAFKGALIAQADLQPGERVLDLACGTGTLAIMARAAHPRTEIVGVDADPQVLSLARGKAQLQDLAVQFDEGLSTELPYRARHFDKVISSLFFHHLKRPEKLRTLAEVRRVLKPGGELHVADWGAPENLLMRFAFLPVQLLDGFDYTGDAVSGRLIKDLRESGFVGVREMRIFRTMLGTMALYRAGKA